MSEERELICPECYGAEFKNVTKYSMVENTKITCIECSSCKTRLTDESLHAMASLGSRIKEKAYEEGVEDGKSTMRSLMKHQLRTSQRHNINKDKMIVTLKTLIKVIAK